MALQIGMPAPAFTGELQDGSTATLQDYAGRTLLLYFYPKDNSPGCTTQACNLRDGYAELRAKGVEVLGVSPDSSKVHTGFIAKHSLPFPLLTDGDHTVAQAYGVWVQKQRCGRTYMGVARQSFLIDGQGTIVHIFDAVKTGAHAQQVLDVLG